MNDIILHHYPQSPVAEKVRTGLGIKNLSWRSVIIPRIPPKPDLMPLSGGYRRTPVMQIGADIYCDSQCILRELEHRYPTPTFAPGGNDGLIWALSRWSDDTLFNLCARIVLSANADELPPEFAKDRGRLYFGPDCDLHAIARDLPHLIAQLRAQFGWLDAQLTAGGPFLLGDTPGLPEALAYYLVWFIRGRWLEGPALLAQFPALEAWEKRVAAIGHGTQSEMDASEALEIARTAQSDAIERTDPNDPQGLAPGQAVSVLPDEDSGDPSVDGVIRAVDRESIAIMRDDPIVGSVCVHFPRVGYRVTAR